MKKNRGSKFKFFEMDETPIVGLPNLVLTPYAFSKMVFFMRQSPNECGSMGIALNPDNPLLINDFCFVKQDVSIGSVKFDDDSIAEFQERMDDNGIQPFQCMRVWQHCHPGDCPQPSMTDEATFKNKFGSSNFAVMLIIARNLSMYCRMRISSKNMPTISIEIPVVIDYAMGAGDGSDIWTLDKKTKDAWKQEFSTNIHKEDFGNRPWLKNIKHGFGGFSHGFNRGEPLNDDVDDALFKLENEDHVFGEFGDFD